MITTRPIAATDTDALVAICQTAHARNLDAAATGFDAASCKAFMTEALAMPIVAGFVAATDHIVGFAAWAFIPQWHNGSVTAADELMSAIADDAPLGTMTALLIALEAEAVERGSPFARVHAQLASSGPARGGTFLLRGYVLTETTYTKTLP